MKRFSCCCADVAQELPMALAKKCRNDNSGQTARSARDCNVQSCSCVVKNYTSSAFALCIRGASDNGLVTL